MSSVQARARSPRAPLMALLLVIPLLAALPSSGAAQEFPVERDSLANGLRVLLVPDHTVPSVCLAVVFHAGSKNERPGITGIAHLFEHMMFNGSARYAPKQFDTILEGGGGYSNAFTTKDFTLYFEEFNSDMLEKAIDMEADRIRALKLDSENLEQERGIVAEERRMRVDDVPRSKLNEEVEAVAFDSHPYGQPVIGWMTDIQHIPLASCKDFFRTYYAPNNAVLCLAGDFDPATARGLIRKAFSDIPAQTPPAAVLESEDPQSGERRLSVSLPAEQPAVNMAYHIVARRDPDYLAYDLLARILGGGESSRLFRDLVYEQQVATGAAAWIDESEQPGLLGLWVDVIPGKSPEEAIARVDSVVAALQKSGVTAAEVDKARNQALTGLARQLTTNGDRVVQLLIAELIDGDYRRVFSLAKDYDRVSAADVTRVARATLIPENRTVGILIPKADSASLEGGEK
jgi:predicted Zn-dependent peptidase